MLRLAILTLLASSALATIAQAQERVSVRSGEHDGYSRLVFDWPTATNYTLTGAQTTALRLSFNKAASLDVSGVDAGPWSNVRKLETTSAPSTPLTLEITVPQGGRLRDFRIGNRIILDIYNPPSGDVRTEKRADPVPPVAAKTQIQTPAPKAAPPQPVTQPPPSAPVQSPPQSPPVQTSAVERRMTQEERPHVITFSSTERMGVAAFERGGYLYFVADNPSMNVPPRLAGPDAASFGAFERVDAEGASAYRTKLPQGKSAQTHLYGEGGGLVFRVVVTPNERDVIPVEPQRHLAAATDPRGGQLYFPMTGATKLVKLTDPSAGDILQVVTVSQATQHTGEPYDFVDAHFMHAPIGMALVPKIDDLQIQLAPDGVTITRPGGLALSRARDVQQRAVRVQQLRDAADDAASGRLLNFDRWLMGGLQALRQNEMVLLASLSDKDESGRVQDLLTLAKMHVANERGQEAVGFLNLAAQLMPAIVESPEFMALRGVAHALAGKFELAYRDLQAPLLSGYNELDPWRSFTLSWLGDWEQAEDLQPNDLSAVLRYPQNLQEKIIPRLAEVRLRGGDVRGGQALLDGLERAATDMQPSARAALDYLKGEAQRQLSQPDEAIKIWEPLLTGRDDFYRVRAGLALTMLQLAQEKITPAQAIDRLESLRYSWRGDELEAQINFMLGRMYIDHDQYLKGFNILRDAVGMSPDSDIGKDIAGYMRGEFNRLLMDDKDLNALDAVMLYEEFRELTPPGDGGNRLVQRLAERLVDTDLLGRASNLLQHQVDYRLSDQQKADVSVRLAAIALLDDNPEQAMRALDTAKSFYSTQTEGLTRNAKIKEIELLRARALLQMDRGEQAIALLNSFEPTPDVNRLRADIAWQGGLWEDAAEALQDLIIDEDMEGADRIAERQADLILNRAVALNLAGDRVELAAMRQRYSPLMDKTPQGALFEVVTRPRSINMMNEQQTITNIVSEVDMFKNVLESYRTVTAEQQKP